MWGWIDVLDNCLIRVEVVPCGEGRANGRYPYVLRRTTVRNEENEAKVITSTSKGNPELELVSIDSIRII